jgi:uncharacterized protein (TIGR02466 family)
MMHFLFPTAVYTDVNTDLLKVANEMYRQSEHMNNPKIRGDFRSTLKAFAPGKAVVYEDVLDWEVTKPLIQYIEHSVREYIKGYKGDVDKYDVHVVNMWLNEMDPGSVHARHSHYGYSLSGTYYVACPPGSNGITLYSPLDAGVHHGITQVTEWTPINSLDITVPVNPGTIVMFSSHVNHSVGAGKYDSVRRSIAFDIILEPKVAITY